MSETRTVTIHIDAVKQTEIRTAVGAEAFYKAIGYLSTWSMTFPEVGIFADTNTDLVAAYKDANGKHGYTIGAIYNQVTKAYGFHS